MRCEYIAQPALRAVAHRLVADGGGGLVIEQEPEGTRGQRLTLWMCPQGNIAEPPRIDRYPYFRIDVDVPNRMLPVWEGDMWNGHGASRPCEPFTLQTLTTDEVANRAIDVMRRVVAYDAVPMEVEP